MDIDRCEVCIQYNTRTCSVCARLRYESRAALFSGFMVQCLERRVSGWALLCSSTVVADADTAY